ncbi:hypothetical protein [Pseudooctadecabacter jejudonensis]|uniref:Uncharacterized protein n=1 Tax=Pseudooctadecabacter jejudonensis TaxID=1391910 RepID=A0A1Y5T1F2_9RHOB|nr:hypothetical protein [Pseudooctadecabacter jejudonensis]SLN53427.1 hypothetical protein PSJ8397_02777 [Pseudooctadecabacter jejudonensis]
MDVTFDTYITVDWSGGNQRPAVPSPDAIWVSIWRYGVQEKPLYFRNRQLLEVWLRAALKDELTNKRRVFVGFDFAFGFPDGFAEAITGDADPLAMWRWLEGLIVDSPKANNRFEVAGVMNSRFDGVGPFWGNASPHDVDGLPRKGSTRTCTAFAEKRAVEDRLPGAFPVWQLAGAGAVGSQTLMGLPVLWRMIERFPDMISVWPFESLDRPIAFVEIWPSLFADQVAANGDVHPIKDAMQVHTMTDLVANMAQAERAALLDVPRNREGWIFGVPA